MVLFVWTASSTCYAGVLLAYLFDVLTIELFTTNVKLGVSSNRNFRSTIHIFFLPLGERSRLGPGWMLRPLLWI